MLIVIVVAALILLTLANQKLLSMKEEKGSERTQREQFRSIRDRLYYCYGTVVDERELLANLDCLQLQGDQGISIKKPAFGECEEGHVKELNYRGYGMIDRFEIPLYDESKTLICPAYLTVYEHAVEVPLLLGVDIVPRIVVQGQQSLVSVEFYHTKPPSYIDIVVFDLDDNERSRQSSGAMQGGMSMATFAISTGSLVPGIFTLSAFATYDNEYYDALHEAARFRVVDPKDMPIVNKAEVKPPNGTIYDPYRIWVNLTDFVQITQVTAIVKRDGVEVARVVLNQTGYTEDLEELISHAEYSGSWDAADMPNENATYKVGITATNILGNTAVVEDIAQIEVIEKPETGGDVLVITNERVFSQLGDSLVEEYRQALLADGYTSMVIRLDNSEDILKCSEELSAVPRGTIKAEDAKRLIPQCIVGINSSYVVILGGHSQVEQHYGGAFENYAWYTDDFYADLNGNGRPDVPIGRLPDGNPPGDDTVQKTLQTAIRLHNERGWKSGGSHYGWTLDNPKGRKSPTNEHIECIMTAMDANNAKTCSDDPNCYFAPPYNVRQNGNPPNWASASDQLYVCGHGNPSGVQQFTDHMPSPVLMGTSRTVGQRDFTNTVFYYNPCLGGRIHNHNYDQSSVLHAMSNGAIAVFAGTTLQMFSSTSRGPCNRLPIGDMYSGSSYLTNLAYEINKQSPGTVGDAWLKWHNRVTTRSQREHNVMYGDPSIRVK
jgi:hypothetical protein